MTHEQIEKLNDIVITLYSVKQDRGTTFTHSDMYG